MGLQVVPGAAEAFTMHHDRCDQGGTAAELLSVNRAFWPVVDIKA